MSGSAYNVCHAEVIFAVHGVKESDDGIAEREVFGGKFPVRGRQIIAAAESVIAAFRYNAVDGYIIAISLFHPHVFTVAGTDNVCLATFSDPAP